MLRSFRILVMVVLTLIIGGLFAVSAPNLHDQAFANGVAITQTDNASPSPNVSADPSATPTPTPTSTESASPTPTPTATSTPPPPPPPFDPTDALLHKEGAQKFERKAKAQRVELVKRCNAFQEPAPAKLKPRKAFDTWKARKGYYKAMFKSFKAKNQAYWKRMVTNPHKLCHPHTEGVKRWLPLLRYCGMPADQMWRAVKVMGRESHGDSWAKNKKSTASGLFQFLRDWWWNKKTGKRKWNPFDPLQNVLHFVRAIKEPGGWSHWAETA